MQLTNCTSKNMGLQLPGRAVKEEGKELVQRDKWEISATAHPNSKEAFHLPKDQGRDGL